MELGAENISDLGLKLLLGMSSTKSFNSFSKLFKSSKLISLVVLELWLTLSFIKNSSPPPKLLDFLPQSSFPPPKLSLKSSSDSSIISLIID